MTKENNNTKFAVIEISGTQLKVSEGLKYEIEKLAGNKGDTITLKEVLMVVDGDDIKIGDPYVKDATVELLIDSQKRGEKIDGFKYTAKSRNRTRFGHRSFITRVEVKKIS